MVDPNVVEVPESKIQELEKEHDFLELIREKVRRIRYQESELETARQKANEAKKKLDNLQDDLASVIEDGPPKPDPQAKLPFAQEADDSDLDDDDELDDDDLDPSESDIASEEGSDVKVPPEIAALDLTDRLKTKLAETGVSTISDVIDLVNGNNPKYPGGLAELARFGPAAVSRLVGQLPSTAGNDDGAPSEVKRVRLLSFGDDKGNGHFEPGDTYEARILDNGSAVIQLPGEEPVTFSDSEYDLAN